MFKLLAQSGKLVRISELDMCLVDKDGFRHFREVFFVCGRKVGKSLLSSALGKHNWFIDGGYGSKVYVVAPKLDQADIVYNNIWQMCVLDEDQQALKKKQDKQRADKKKIEEIPEIARHRQSDLYLPANNGQVKKIAFSANQRLFLKMVETWNI